MGKKNYTIKNTNKRNPLNVIIVIVTLIILSGLIYTTQGGKDQDKPISLNTEPASLVNDNPLDKNSSYDKATKKVYLITDKWSLLNIPNKDYVINVNNYTAALAFTPLSASDYVELRKKNPSIISKALARFYSSTTELSCTKEVCSISGREIDPSILATPKSIPTFGEIYANYNIDSILYKAEINLPINSDVVGISATGLRSSSLIYGSSDDGSSTSYNYISNAFGIIYEPTILWNNDSDFSPQVRYVFEENSISRGPLLKNSEIFGLLSKGQGYTNPLLFGLNPSILSYFSSPTTGCGSTAICVPGALNTTVELGKSYNYNVCDVNKSKANIYLTYGKLNFQSLKPTFIPGLSSYKSESSKFVTGVLGEPNLISGEQSYYTFEAALVTQDGTIAIAGGRALAPDLLPKPTLAQLFAGKYTEC